MFKKILHITALFFLTISYCDNAFSADDEIDYTTMSQVELQNYKGSYGIYQYIITQEFIDLKHKFSVDGKISTQEANNILRYAKEWFNYLPQTLANKNLYVELKSSIERGLKYPENSSYFEDITSKIQSYLDNVNIQKIKWSIDVAPSEGNAPLTVSFRANVVDPTGTKLENYNYTWWVSEGWKRKVLANRIGFSYVFKEEGTHTVFLDVTSNHKNSLGNTDVLPLTLKRNIVVKEKIASMILKVNSQRLGEKDELKFTPEESSYGLLFDATSSSPTSSSKFVRTEWDFGNGITKRYNWDPNLERVKYVKEWEYTVKLKLTTNEWKSVERKFLLKINNPIATIGYNKDQWFMGDKFTFTANPSGSYDNLKYVWKIIDLKNDKEVFSKNNSTFTYTFNDKWSYNVKLEVTEPSGERDVDTKVIYINSREPVAKFVYSIPQSNKPNTVFLDATSSYDPDFTDEWNLRFDWEINGARVSLDNPNYNGSNGYYTFNDISDHSVTLYVTDPDDMSAQVSEKVNIKSLLSLDFYPYPRVSQINKNLQFVADSQYAKYFEWDFWDGNIEWWTSEKISHSFKESWVYQVKLKVIDENDNENSFSKKVYIWETDTPYAYINLENQSGNVSFDANACNWEWAYVVNRVDSFTLSWEESIDITWKSTGLTYSWKINNDLYDSRDVTKRFDELGCSKVKLTVKSIKNGKQDSEEINIFVKNLKPVFSSLDIDVNDLDSDPVIVNVTALWAKDLDWVIQSYLWYYYTDLDPSPQDFRATRWNSTSFVLPNIAWEYFFAVVMKDNNWERFNTWDLKDSKYSIPLVGDNINTPLIDLKVDDNSIWLGDEVTFTVNVENILWYSLNKSSEYSWDFDWDGFYDTKTDTNVATFSYKQSWEINAKVKVKHKWYSNTKTIKINVENTLTPDFDFVSVWNDVILMDKSIWSNYEVFWDLWDWNMYDSSETVKHTYTDWKSVHLVRLKITEWTKTKEIVKKVVKDYSNYINVKKDDFPVLSNYSIENGIISIEKEDDLYLYIASSDESISNYVADFDLSIDSDLNWWNDDDKDNASQNSYTSGSAIKIDLNNFKNQTIRVYTLDNSWNVLWSKDITVIKNYLEEENIDLDSIKTDWLSESTKLKLEKLKEKVSSFPKEHKLKWTMYVQKLIEEWYDDREKTNIILEFEGYIYDSEIAWWTEIIDILEWLLVEWENDKSEKAIAFTALKNLIPDSIACNWETEVEEWKTCKEALVSKLEVISNNTNIDENRELWTQILKNIESDEVMTSKQKTDFKAILKTLVYGSVSKIPEEDKQEVINEPQEWVDDEGWFIDVIISILKFIFYIILILSWLIGLFYVFYIVANKDKNKSFSEFVTDKTSWNKTQNTGLKDSDLDIELDSWNDDILSMNSSFEEIKQESPKVEEVKKEEVKKETSKKEEVKEDLIVEDGWVPDWLKWTFDEEPKKEENKEAPKVEEIKKEEEKKEAPKKEEAKEDLKVEDGWVPDWLKWTFEEEPKKEEKKETPKVEEKKEVPKNEEAKEDLKVEDGWVPDWLKWTFEEEPKKVEKKETPKAEEVKKESKNDVNSKDILPEDFTKDDLDNLTSLDSEEKVPLWDDIPDWLKVDANESEKNTDSSKKTTEKKSTSKTSKKTSTKNKTEVKKSSNIKEDKKTEVKKVETKKEEEKKSNNNPESELWDDGMKIPDWLKTDDDK